MVNTEARTLAVFSHPNHEVAVYGLVMGMKPALVYLTDGGGGLRIAQTRQGLSAAGLTNNVSYFNCTEDSFYKAILELDTVFFLGVASRLSTIISGYKPTQVFVDSVEFYNPVHDIALPIVMLALKMSDVKARIFSVPLVYQASKATDKYVFQRAIPSFEDVEETHKLGPLASTVKRDAIKNIYTVLTNQMQFTPEVVEQGCSEEHVFRGGTPFEVDPGCVIRYDYRGSAAVASGMVKQAISHKEHYLPLVSRLFS